MMGSKEEDVPVEPTEKPSFIEDMTEAERNTAVSITVAVVSLITLLYLIKEAFIYVVFHQFIFF